MRLVTEYGYDVDKNLISQKTLMFGMEEVSSPLGKLTGLQPQIPFAADKRKPTVLVDNTYSYDNNANRIEKHTLMGLNRFTYDSVNRLVKAEYPTGAAEYRYDKAGNRTAKVWTGADATTGMEEQYHYDSCNRLTRHDITPTDSTKYQEIRYYSYDAQGNMLSDGNRQFVYDAMNRLTEIKNEDGTHQKNYYDGEGLRAELEENGRLVSFIFDGDKVVSEKEDQNTIRYIRGYELISSDSEKARTYYHYACDEMGSITHVTDEEGSVLNRYEYDAFGDCTYKEETVANRFGFAGEQFDPVAGMYYLRARFYNPVIGKFIQEDTYYGDGLNLYAYCHNNPVGYVDPSGHAAACLNKQKALKLLEEKLGKDIDLEEAYQNFKRELGVDGKLADAITVRKALEEKYGKSYSYEQYCKRMNQTPSGTGKVLGKWSGDRGNSKFIPDDPKLQKLLAKYGIDGIEYRNGEVIFDGVTQKIKLENGELITAVVQIEGMQGGKRGRDYNFTAAYEELSKKTGLSVETLEQILEENDLVWHECNDMKSMQMVPYNINKYFKHLGGVGEINLYFDFLEGLFG